MLHGIIAAFKGKINHFYDEFSLHGNHILYDILYENWELFSHKIAGKIETRCHFHFPNMFDLWQSMPLEWRMSIQNSMSSNKVTSHFVIDEDKLDLLSNLTAKFVYEMFCSNKHTTSSYSHKWNEIHKRRGDEWAKIFTRTFKVVREIT